MSVDLIATGMIDEAVEDAIITSAMRDRAAAAQCADIHADDFGIMSNRIIWQAILDLMKRGLPADLTALKSELTRRQQLDTIGGVARLVQLSFSAASHPDNIEAYHEAFLTARSRRRAAHEALRIQSLAVSGGASADELAAAWSAAGTKLAHGTHEVSWTDVLDERLARAERLVLEPELPPGLMTGLKNLDDQINGYQPGTLVIVGGRPGMGKTALMATQMLNMLKVGQRVGFISLEMTRRELADRFISMLSGIPLHIVTAPMKMTPDQYTRYVAAAGEMQQLTPSHDPRFFVTDRPAMTLDQIRATIHRWHALHDLDAVFLDYIGLIGSSASGRRPENRVQEVGAWARGLKQIAREIDRPLISAAQLSRTLESRGDKRPQLSDLRESGEIEQEADIVMFLYREARYDDAADPELAELNVAKFRAGPPGMVNLRFIGPQTLFTSAVMRRVDLGV